MVSPFSSPWFDPPQYLDCLTRPVARGTSEPNYEEGDGKFGFIVGDPIVSNVTEILSEARGYPVQVRIR